MENIERRHLGEDLYASCDGYHIWLEKILHSPDTFQKIVALEPSVFFALSSYAKRSGFGTNSNELSDPTYLGDGVYAHHIPSVITLSVGSHLAPVDVVLTRELFQKLEEYAEYIGQLAKE
jgi:hypothetical protein